MRTMVQSSRHRYGGVHSALITGKFNLESRLAGECNPKARKKNIFDTSAQSHADVKKVTFLF